MPASHLIVGGTTRAATTSLFNALAAHPDVRPAGVKETRFFLPSAYPRPSRSRLDRDGPHAYGDLFGEGAGVRLEATPDYLYSADAARAVARHLPSPVVVFVLRDPIDRLLSWHRFGREHRLFTGSIDAYLAAQTDDAAAPYHLRERARGRYVDHLAAWTDALPDATRIVFFEDLTTDPAGVLRGVTDAVGLPPLDAAHLPAMNRSRPVRWPALGRLYFRLGYVGRHYLHRAPPLFRALRWAKLRVADPVYDRINTASRRYAPPSADALADLVRYYRPSVAALERLVGRPVPWPRFATPHTSPPTGREGAR